MDFIEKVFGISPDAGSGVLEYCLIAVPLGFLVLRAILKREQAGSTDPWKFEARPRVSS